MSCRNCDAIEIENMKGKNKAFLRVGVASILICACDKHFNLIRQKIGLGVLDIDDRVFRVNDPDRN